MDGDRASSTKSCRRTRTLLTEALKQYPSDVFEIKKEGAKKKKTITPTKYLSTAPPMKKHQLQFYVPMPDDLKDAFKGMFTAQGNTDRESLTARTFSMFQLAMGKLGPDQLFALFAQYLIIGASANVANDVDDKPCQTNANDNIWLLQDAYRVDGKRRDISFTYTKFPWVPGKKALMWEERE
ncbi:hypothetical protein HDU86_001736 [Geranomyces michiganensis]|nr:hypothetical protein HDU86_001736 [Geranomyces michiganensis]